MQNTYKCCVFYTQFAYIKINSTFATVMSPRLRDYVFEGGQLQDIIKGVITRFVLGISEPGKF